jgi:ankyrin repeat protein
MEAGASVGAQNHRQYTPLHLAAQYGHAEVCRALMEAGAVVGAQDDQQITPLHLAAQYGHAAVCRVLMEAGAVIEAQNVDQHTPLHMAAAEGYVEVCCTLIKAGAAVGAQDSQQTTPLHMAAQLGHAEVCRVLMEAGAAVGARNVQQCTPLHFAATKGHVEVCRILLMKARAAVDARSDDQRTPLHFAARSGHDSTSMLLVFEGADLTARTSFNQTPASLALRQGHAALAAHLRSSNGAHCLRCTGPSLERRLLWNDTNQQQQETMLDEMQTQWLARVAEGCAHARVGLTLRGAFSGGLSTRMLLHVMGYVFGGTLAHLQSCISIGRVAATRGLATQTAATAAVVDGATVAAEAAGAVPAANRAKVGDTGKGGPMQEPAQHVQEKLLPKLALVSHALALAATPAPQPVGSGSTGVMSAGARQHLQAALASLAAESAKGGCEWLQAYCDFLQRRHLGLGSER